MNVRVRNDYELKLMRKSGEITAKALKKVLESVKEGITLKELDRIATEEILRLGAQISFATEPGYSWATCMTVNEEVVHGIPRDIALNKGDLLSIDIGALYKGWHTDASWSVIVGGGSSKFLEAGERALWAGIEQATSGKRIGDISNAIQKEIEKDGFSVNRNFVGHGVGKHLHEDPIIPGIGKAGVGMLLKSGMTLAIEAIYQEKGHQVEIASDGWTVVTKDGGLGGLYDRLLELAESKDVESE